MGWINWAEIKVTVVPADAKSPNPQNSHSGLSKMARKQAFINICSQIWARHIRESAQATESPKRKMKKRKRRGK